MWQPPSWAATHFPGQLQCSVELRDADARVKRLQDFVIREAGARKAVGPDLAHADAVAPAAAREGEAGDAARVVKRAVDDEELLAQAEGGADAAAAHVRRGGRADDFEVEHAA